MQTQGKKDPEKVAKIEKANKIKELLKKRPNKNFAELTPKEKTDATDAMLEWWMQIIA